MKHLFFDLDRTLWDFEANSTEALKILYEQHRLGDYLRSFQSFYNAYKQHNARLWNAYGKGKISKEELRFRRFNDTLQQFQVFMPELAHTLGEQYIAISPYQTRLFPNTIETLESLKREDYQLHIITNGFKEVQHIKLRESKLTQYFDLILCSEEIGLSKPDPAVFLHAMEVTKADKEGSIMIGDDYEVDVLGALNAGMQAVLYDPNGHYHDKAYEWLIRDHAQLPEKITWMRRSSL